MHTSLANLILVGIYNESFLYTHHHHFEHIKEPIKKQGQNLNGIQPKSIRERCEIERRQKQSMQIQCNLNDRNVRTFEAIWR